MFVHSLWIEHVYGRTRRLPRITLRHDSIDRSSFVPGVLLAVA
ncbi:hypothetical protein [Dactylosporangium sp. CA-139066]